MDLFARLNSLTENAAEVGFDIWSAEVSSSRLGRYADISGHTLDEFSERPEYRMIKVSGIVFNPDHL